MTKKIEQVKPVCNDQLDSHGSADEVVGTIGQICKQTDTPAYKMAYRKAYDKAQAGGMNNSDSNDFAIEQAEFAIKQAEISAKSEDKATARPQVLEAWRNSMGVTAIGSDTKHPLFKSFENDLELATELVKRYNGHAALVAVAKMAKSLFTGNGLVSNEMADALAALAQVRSNK